MKSDFTKARINKIAVIGCFLTAVLLYWLARYNYLFYHTTAESFIIFVSLMTYVLASKTYRYSNNNYLLFIGYTNLFVAILQFWHLINYYGMGIFPNSSPDVATQFWIASGYLEALSIFIAPFFIGKKFSRPAVVGAFTLVTVFLVAAIMWFRIFPHCYLAGVGLTPLKVFSEYIISLLMFAAIIHLYRKRRLINDTLYYISTSAMAMAILSHIVFTLYIDVYGFINYLGHVFVIVSNYLFLTGVIVYGLEEPYGLIFSELRKNAITDQLTGIYNRNGLYELSEQKKAKAGRERTSFALLMIDIDKFKKINDQFGHSAGDRVLCNFARIIGDATKGKGDACRLGGDEFVILLDDVSHLGPLQNTLRQELLDWQAYDKVVKDIGISIGAAVWEPGDAKSIFELLAEADRKMYAEKTAKSHEHSGILP